MSPLKTTPTIALAALLTSAALLAAPGEAAADTQLYDWPDETAPVLIVSEGNLIFLHKDGKPYRAYSWRRNDDDGVHVVDIDRDGGPDIVGMGRPAFAIGTDGDPLWLIKKGCKIGLVADMVADDKLDFVCSDGRRIKVYTHDKQFVWEIDLSRRFRSCQVGDTNGDQKADLECKLSKTQIARIDGNGELITAEAEDSLILTDAPYEPFAAVGEEVITSKKLYDLDRDGTAEEYVTLEDELLLIKSKSKPKPLAMIKPSGKPTGVLVKDLDADGTAEIIVTSKDEVLVLSPDGKRKDSFSLNASSYKRSPLADLQSVYANGFGEADEAAAASVSAIQDELSSCYASQVKKSDFAGSGQLLLTVNVDTEGKITRVDKLHSEIADNSVVKCAMGKLKKAKVPPAAEEGGATVNVTMTFTFRDQ